MPRAPHARAADRRATPSPEAPADLSAALVEQARAALAPLLRDAPVVLTLVLRVVALLLAGARGLVDLADLADLHRDLHEPPAAAGDAWPRLLALLRRLPAPSPALELPDVRPPALPDGALARLLDALRLHGGAPVDPRRLDVEHLGSVYEALRPGDARRRAGAHYTPATLTAPVVRTALAPVLAALGERPTPAQILELKLCDPAAGSGAFLLEACRQLADALQRAWHDHGPPPDLDPGDALDHARRLVARRCLRGVDRDPVAVDLARLSLDLLARVGPHARERADAAIVACGDSLIGPLPPPLADPPRVDPALLRRAGAEPLAWAAAFPEVFARDNPGFDCCVGNPPFLGGTKIRAALSADYLALLTAAFPGAGNRADLVAYFFRRGFDLLRDGGTLGLIGTNTLAQGDTRGAGLAHIRGRGGAIYQATRRLRWPGGAAVVACVVHIVKGRPRTPAVLDGAPVPAISAFLLRGDDDREPARLRANRGLVFTGMKPYADGLIFADDNPKATPLAEMRRLIAEDPRNAERIFPYLGGDEINAHPRQQPHRHIIHFGTMDEPAAARWPALLAIARARVLPERRTKAPDVAAAPWWQFWRPRPELSARLAGLPRALVGSQVSTHHALVFQPTDRVFSHALNVFVLPEAAAFALLQSRVHELWARTFGSSMKDDLRYTPSDCFETFPLPPAWRDDPALESAGRRYHAHRAALMVARDEGLTRTYHRFHDPATVDPALLQLRDLHDELDRAALTAYGWTDLAARVACEFRLDHDEPAARPRRRPWRWRWPQELHDEALARLLDLGHRRAAAERRRG